MERFHPLRAAPVPSAPTQEIIFMILQSLGEENFKESVHKLEQESGLFFDMKYFEDQVEAGQWKEVERYLSGFVKVNGSDESRAIFFEIRKQKYVETLDRHDRPKALKILEKELKVCANEESHLDELTHLLPLDNFRQNEKFSNYGDVMSQRKALINILRSHIELNPLFRHKLEFPAFQASSLRKMIESHKIQHELCKDSNPSPDMNTRHTNSTCLSNKGNDVPDRNTTLSKLIPRRKVSHPLEGHHSSQPVISFPTGNASWMSSVNRSHDVPGDDRQPAGLVWSPTSAAVFNHPRNSHDDLAMEYQTANPQHSMTQHHAAQPDEVLCSSATHPTDVYTADDLPKTFVKMLGEGLSFVTSMDFHPQKQNRLLVGSMSGEIIIWELASEGKLQTRPFQVSDISARSMQFQTIMKKAKTLPVERCTWSPDGCKLGVAFSIHIVQIYSYGSIYNTERLEQLFEIEAHAGRVNDIVFVNPKGKSRILTCGEDKTIKIWDADLGVKYHTFEGHGAPVCSICPQCNQSDCIFYSISTDGKMKAWRCDSFELIANHDTLGFKYRRLACNADETRIFCSITSKQDACQLVEWGGSEGVIKRTCLDGTNVDVNLLGFETIGNHFFAVGGKRQIEFWDADNGNMLACTDSIYPLQPRTPIRVNKSGSLLSAARAFGGGFIILANADGRSELKMLDSRSSKGGS